MAVIFNTCQLFVVFSLFVLDPVLHSLHKTEDKNVLKKSEKANDVSEIKPDLFDKTIRVQNKHKKQKTAIRIKNENNNFDPENPAKRILVHFFLPYVFKIDEKPKRKSDKSEHVVVVERCGVVADELVRVVINLRAVSVQLALPEIVQLLNIFVKVRVEKVNISDNHEENRDYFLENPVVLVFVEKQILDLLFYKLLENVDQH